MAIWQFSIEFIPKTSLIKFFGEIPKQIGEDLYWQKDFAEGVKLPEDYESFLIILGEKETIKWAKNRFNWGNYDEGSHITINCDNMEKVTVFSRFHVGDLDLDFVKTVLEFAKLCNCVLLTKNQNIIEPELNLFLEELRNSNSYRFCQNPIGYLQSDEVKEIDWSNRKRLEDDKLNINR